MNDRPEIQMNSFSVGEKIAFSLVKGFLLLTMVVVVYFSF